VSGTAHGAGAVCYTFRARWCLALLLPLVMLAAGCGSGARESGSVMRMLERVKARGKLEKGWLRVVSFRQSSVTDRDLHVMRGIAYLKVLDLQGTETTDTGVAFLKNLPSLQELGLARTRISDAALVDLDRFPALRVLEVTGTAISDEGLRHLHSLTTLRKVDVTSTRVSAAGVAALRAALPGCEVIFDSPATRAPPDVLPDTGRTPEHVSTDTPSSGIAADASPRTPVRPRAAPPRQQAQDRHDNLAFTWQSPFGPGGFVLPRLDDWHGPAQTPDAPFRRLIGLITDERGELIFLGVDEPGWPVISTEDLLDGLAVALRSLAQGQPPGVTFEPRTASLAQPRDQDPLDVEYFGVAAGTVVGNASYEADRLMKSLSAGQDTLTRQPVTSAVPGWKSELDLIFDQPSGQKSGAWHRFWIEPAGGQVRHAAGVLTAELNLAIQTRYQTIRQGKLVDAPQTADPAARTFANLLTRHYRDFAAEQPAFAETYNYAVLSSLANVLLTESAAWTTLRQHSRDHDPRFRSTPTTTPSLVVQAERTSGNRIQRAQIAGGVTLSPVPHRADATGDLARLRTAVLSGRPRDQARAVWSVDSKPRPVVAASAAWRRRRQVWQTDCRSGMLELTRDLIRDPVTEQDHWKVRVPELRIQASAGSVSERVEIQTADGQWVTLAPGKMTLPVSSGETPGFLSADKSQLLAQYRNRWIQVDEPVRYESVNGGPIHPVVGPGGRFLEFAPTPPHRVQAVLTSEGLTRYEWDSDRLTAIRHNDSEIRLRYDPRGRLLEARTDQGETVDYRYRGDQTLRAVRRNKAAAIHYAYDGLNQLARITLPAETQDRPPAARQLAVEVASPEEEELQRERNAAAAGLTVLAIRSTPDMGLKLVLNGAQQLDAIEPDDAGELPRDAEIAAQFVTALASQLARLPAGQPIVIAGPLLDRIHLAAALRAVAPGRRIYVTADLERAQAHLARDVIRGHGVRHEVVSNGLLKEVAHDLVQVPQGDAAAALTILSGHNEGGGGGIDRRLGTLIDTDEIDGRFVFLNTCFKASTGPRIDALVVEGGAVAVVGFQQPVDQRLLAPLAEELVRLFTGRDQFRIEDFEQLFSRAVETVISRGIVNEIDAALLRNWYLQVRRDPVRHPLVSSRLRSGVS